MKISRIRFATLYASERKRMKRNKTVNKIEKMTSHYDHKFHLLKKKIHYITYTKKN